jgi:hypothetical protein
VARLGRRRDRGVRLGAQNPRIVSRHRSSVELDPTDAALWSSGQEALIRDGRPARGLHLVPVVSRDLRDIFDEACNRIHYAGACRRVGRCLRLAVVHKGEWAGGTVLGSPFPNIGARDEAFGLTAFTRGYRERGLVSPWASENREYWDRLQGIVNHARTFVFPQFQGLGLGVRVVSMLPSEGREYWESAYAGPVVGFDTHCTSPTSRLFLDNGWELVGRTKGFSRDGKRVFSQRAAQAAVTVRDNAALTRRRRNVRWWTWVLRLDS